MESSFLKLLISPESGNPLSVESDSNGQPVALSDSNGHRYPIRNSIVRFVPDDDFAESFGFQWNRFEVRQEGEDEATFEAKTGVRLSELANRLVMDAGCGGGRYLQVASQNGATILGVDRSSAVEKARQMCKAHRNVEIIQADLANLPVKPGQFDLVFSIGVIHHSPDPVVVLRSLAKMVKPGGRLTIWVYRKATWPQEVVNNLLRGIASRISHRTLAMCCKVAGVIGGIPLISKVLNKIVSFSAHPNYENRVCDTFDWYAPVYQSHHTPPEVIGWFRELGFTEIVELPPEKTGRWYRLFHRMGLLIGSGVNVTGIRAK